MSVKTADRASEMLRSSSSPATNPARASLDHPDDGRVRRAVLRRGPELGQEIPDPPAGGPGLVQGLESEVEHLAVVRGEQQVADVERIDAPGQEIRQRVELPFDLDIFSPSTTR